MPEVTEAPATKNVAEAPATKNVAEAPATKNVAKVPGERVRLNVDMSCSRCVGQAGACQFRGAGSNIVALDYLTT